jgi:hypothetical protein
MNKKVKDSFLFCLALLALFAASCNNIENNIPVKDKIDLALSVIPVYDWEELRTTIGTAPNGAIIGIMRNIEATTTSILINTGKTVTLAAFEGEVVISRGSYTGALFSVLAGTLILGDSRGGTLVLDGERLSGITSALVSVGGTGALTLNEGAVLRNNITIGNGGGVSFGGSTFTMNGGTISGNESTSNGGGVYVMNSPFTMKGGTISGNIANNQGGGVYINTATFNMYNGTISGNISTSHGGGVFVGGGNITKTGGTIYGNDDTTHTPPENTSSTNNGHAVYRSSGNRNSTAGPDVVLNSYITGSAGGWE